jgi:integrase
MFRRLRRTVAVRLAEIADNSGPVAANRVRASLSACFAWLLREGIVENNPVAATNKAAERGPRTRLLADDELAAIWRAAADRGHYGAIVRLLILTGARRAEIANLCWSEIDLGRALIELPAARTKNGRPHAIPLTAPALEILHAQPRRPGRDYVFSFGAIGFQDWVKEKNALDARIKANGAPLAPWTLHDFRRAISTTMHERLGVPPHIVESVLAHVGGHKAGVAGVYNRSLYEREKRIALTQWAEHVLAAIDGRASNVMPIRSA